jgi:hypothetical protein
MASSILRLAASVALASGVLAASTGAAKAFTFTTNDFNGSNKPDAKGDIFLNSVTLGSTGEVVTNFSFVTSASIVYNDEYTGGNSGAASADIGDNATTGVKVEAASNADIATNLGTNNLNNIIDTEDSGSFQIDLSFGKTIDNLLVWERGMNSRLAIQALDAGGNLIGNKLKLGEGNYAWNYAGYDIDTKEIGGSQKVGSFGVSIAEDLGVNAPISSLRFFSEANFNGPDWKFVGTDSTRPDPEEVPEPGLLLGLGMLGSVMFLKRQRAFQ